MVGIDPTKTMEFVFNDMPVSTILTNMSERLGFVIINTGALPTARVTIQNRKPVNAEEAVKLFNEILVPMGYVALQTNTPPDPVTGAGGSTILRVVTLGEGKKAQIPVIRGSDPASIPLSDDLRTQIKQMGQIMEDSLGIGLAATQVGKLQRVLVYRVEPDSPVNAVVNPQIEWSGDELETAEEGCLSLQGVLVDVERPVFIRVRAQDEHGDPITIEASGLEARVLQHEIDHLDGVLILDRTARDQRKAALRILREAAEQAA